MALAAVLSKAAIMFCWFIDAPIVLGFVFVSWFLNHLTEEERAGCVLSVLRVAVFCVSSA